jgi:hypothetical protein
MKRTEDSVQAKLRLRRELRERLEAAAAQRGVSLNGEIAHRLERSFSDDEAGGGAEVRELARVWAAAFLRGGSLGARARSPDRGIGSPPTWPVGEWITDPFAFRAAVYAANDALLMTAPPQLPPDHPDAVEFKAELDRLLAELDQLLHVVARGGAVRLREVNTTEGQGQSPEGSQ